MTVGVIMNKLEFEASRREKSTNHGPLTLVIYLGLKSTNSNIKNKAKNAIPWFKSSILRMRHSITAFFHSVGMPVEVFELDRFSCLSSRESEALNTSKTILRQGLTAPFLRLYTLNISEYFLGSRAVKNLPNMEVRKC